MQYVKREDPNVSIQCWCSVCRFKADVPPLQTVSVPDFFEGLRLFCDAERGRTGVGYVRGMLVAGRGDGPVHDYQQGQLAYFAPDVIATTRGAAPMEEGELIWTACVMQLPVVQKTSSTEIRPELRYWIHFAYPDGSYELFESETLAENHGPSFYDAGIIVDGMEFDACEWPWPLPLATKRPLTQAERAIGILNDLLPERGGKAFTGLLGSRDPYKTLANQLIDRLRTLRERIIAVRADDASAFDDVWGMFRTDDIEPLHMLIQSRMPYRGLGKQAAAAVKRLVA